MPCWKALLDRRRRVCLASAKLTFQLRLGGTQMNVAWGSRLSGETKGLDVMGIRALDQNIEASLTNGITTISIRGALDEILA